MLSNTQNNSTNRSANTIPELEQSKAVVLSTLASEHSREVTNTPSTDLFPGIAVNPD